MSATTSSSTAASGAAGTLLTPTQRHGGVGAPRLRAPSWRDPRLLVGVLLVLASVLLGARVVAAADSTTPVWAAARTLVPGQAVTGDALRVVRVHLEGGTSGYLPATDDPPQGLVALREVDAGDLLPRSAVGSSAALTTRPVGLPVTGPLPSGLVAGALVDVWVTPPAQRSAAVAAGGEAAAASTEPRRLAQSAVVAEVVSDGGSFASTRGQTVQVQLDPDELQEALQALAAEAAVSLVLVPGSTPEGS